MFIICCSTIRFDLVKEAQSTRLGFTMENKSYILKPYIRGRRRRGLDNTMEKVPKCQLGKQYNC